MGKIALNRYSALLETSKVIYKTIAASVKRGLWVRTEINEKPTKERIRCSIPWSQFGLYDYDEINFITDTIYPKLRKNGILAKLR